MLTFFRKIRKALLDSGSTRKYLLYAIGEILLVMIGILLALQVNNWNEWRKDRLKETKILEELVENLEVNANTLEQLIKMNYRRDSLSSEIIISALESKLLYDDSLDNHFGYALNMSSGETVVSFIGFESMRNTGFDIVRNDELKKEIIELFELTYDKSEGRSNRVGHSYAEVEKLKHKRLLRKPGFRFAPFDYSNLVEDQEFLSWLYTIKDNRNWINQSHQRSLRETERVLQRVKVELEDNR
jgi:hypothetical protein